MKRGEAWLVSFDSSIGGEIRKKRPAVIVSNDASNKYLNRIQVVPITSKVDRVYPCEARIMLNAKECKAKADQLTTASKSRLFKKIGILSNEDLQRICKAIKIQLDL